MGQGHVRINVVSVIKWVKVISESR